MISNTEIQMCFTVGGNISTTRVTALNLGIQLHC